MTYLPNDIVNNFFIYLHQINLSSHNFNLFAYSEISHDIKEILIYCSQEIVSSNTEKEHFCELHSLSVLFIHIFLNSSGIIHFSFHIYDNTKVR